jgi:hypothetical protein
VTCSSRIAGAAVGVVLALALAVPARAVDLLPHRAAYRMALAEASRASGIVAAQGVMEYQFGRRCDGWTVENRTYLRLTYEGGGDTETVWTFASWESADGLGFRFRAHFQEGGKTVERIQGSARLGAKNGAGQAVLSLPDDRTIDLPPGTLFPTEHVSALIAAAETGTRTLSRIVFDGASLDNPYVVNAVFGALGQDAAKELAAATGLAPLPVWWTQLAFFPERNPGSLPEFELGARYRADGVADQIVQRFSDFSLKVRLNEFQALPAPDC